MAEKLNIKINQGETYRHTIFWTNSSGVAINLTNYSARMHVRAKVSSPTPLLTLTTANGGIVFGVLANGEIKLYISATDTSLIDWVAGVYDLEMVDSITGDVVRLIEGSVSVSKEVTR